MLIESFNTPRLRASPILSTDWYGLWEAITSDLFPSELPLASLDSAETVQNWCENHVLNWSLNSCFVWSIRKVKCDNILGQVTLLPSSDQLVLAYWINPNYWGNGYATEICSELISHLVNNGYQGKVWAYVHDWNVRSESVLKKIGFELMAMSRDNKSGELVKEYLFILGMT